MFRIPKTLVCVVAAVFMVYFVSQSFHYEINAPSMYILTDNLVISRLTI
jgi:hypothetical protein